MGIVQSAPNPDLPYSYFGRLLYRDDYPLLILEPPCLSFHAHTGYFEVRLCPLPGTTDAAEKRAFSESCFAKHPLTVKLPGGRVDTKYWMYRKGERHQEMANPTA